jgi:hypothetical protein
MVMAGGFLAISPTLRQDAFRTALQTESFLDSHSPYSYLVAMAVVVGMAILLARSVAMKR